MRFIGKFSVPLVLTGVLLVIGLVMVPFNVGNHDTPASYVGYVTEEPIFGESKFVGLQVGPTSTGMKWRRQVVNISITPYSFEESFRGQDGVLAKDNLKIEFAVHIVWQVDPKLVKEFVENYTSLLSEVKLSQEDIDHKVDEWIRDAYDNNIKQPIRTFAREEVERHAGLEIKDHTGQIGKNLFDRATQLCAGTPFKIISANIGAPQPPTKVITAINSRQSKIQLLEQKKTEVEIARKDKERRIIDARGVAESMEKISESLTDEYLLHAALEAQRKMVKSPNHTTIYVPAGANPTIMVPSSGSGK